MPKGTSYVHSLPPNHPAVPPQRRPRGPRFCPQPAPAEIARTTGSATSPLVTSPVANGPRSQLGAGSRISLARWGFRYQTQKMALAGIIALEQRRSLNSYLLFSVEQVPCLDLSSERVSFS